MALEIIRENSVRDVSLLEDADVRFVSLVKNASNRQPFRVIKSEKGGTGEYMNLGIQSICLAGDMSIEKLAEKAEMGWLTDLKEDKVEDCGDYRRYVQAEVDKFEKDSIQLIRLEDNAWVLAGNVAADVEKSDIISFGSVETEKAEVPMAPIDTPMGDTASAVAASLVMSFRDLYYKELDAMQDIVRGALSQSSGDPKKRKVTAVNAVEAFKNFLIVGLDAIKASAVKMDKTETTKEDTTVSDQIVFKDQAEFDAAVTAVVETKMKEKADADSIEVEKLAAVKLDLDEKELKNKSETENTETMTAMKTKMEGMETELKILKDKADNDEQQVDTDGKTGDDDKTDVDKKDKDVKKSVFAGILH